MPEPPDDVDDPVEDADDAGLVEVDGPAGLDDPSAELPAAEAPAPTVSLPDVSAPASLPTLSFVRSRTPLLPPDRLSVL
ncbi:hypothetical protein FDG2_5984 [Candidatus Protofrankia californiensis]|uniref:Uncharacterized protein n=1 Tax=Candidatus Protofrankia californiensis TaxID=1839754 RepID=A0A1C3PG22_9ACTN|nr:hypothetical protein FDG2_5984 [Candidatus Protofrankia californiensis]